MNLMRFALAVDAPAKWVLNAQVLLELRRDYSEARARVLALTRVLEAEAGLPLGIAYRRAVALSARPPVGGAWAIRVGDVTLAVDRPRFLTRFAIGLSRARVPDLERRRGRPPATRGSALARAEAYGVDLSLLRASLRRTPGERLRRLDEDVEFFRSLKVAAP